MSEGKDMMSLDDILAKQKASTRNFIDHLENEENGERIESVDTVQNEMIRDRKSTDRNKTKFINEIKSGLGEDIKKNNAYGVKIHKVTIMERIKLFFVKLYSNF